MNFSFNFSDTPLKLNQCVRITWLPGTSCNSSIALKFFSVRASFMRATATLKLFLETSIPSSLPNSTCFSVGLVYLTESPMTSPIKSKSLACATFQETRETSNPNLLSILIYFCKDGLIY